MRLGSEGEMWCPLESQGVAPCSRGKHSATLLGGHIYVLGGRGGSGALPLRDFWRFSLGNGKWERLKCHGCPPPALQQHSVVGHEGKLYVFGGESAPSDETPMWIYDTKTATWRKLPGESTSKRDRIRDPRARCGPRGRRGHSAHALEDCLLIYGGYMDLKGSTNEMWAFHYETERWQRVVSRGGLGPHRHRHAAVLDGSVLYVHGGQQDLHDSNELWLYSVESRRWRRSRADPAPAARAGHAAVSHGAYLYIFGGETNATPINDMWRFHYATECWERICQGLSWPAPRTDSCVLIVDSLPVRLRSANVTRIVGTTNPTQTRPEPPSNLFKEISKLSNMHLRRRSNRCSYSMLSGEQDSTESLMQQNNICKSTSAYVIDTHRVDLEMDDLVLPTPVLSPVEATKLVYIDPEDELDVQREIDAIKKQNAEKNKAPESSQRSRSIVAIPKSASVRFTKETNMFKEEEGESSTSEYASIEKVNRLSLGFCNPHYMGPDVRKLGSALTPDSGVSAGEIEMQEICKTRQMEHEMFMLLLGGREPSHLALLQRPMPMWTYQLNTE